VLTARWRDEEEDIPAPSVSWAGIGAQRRRPPLPSSLFLFSFEKKREEGKRPT